MTPDLSASRAAPLSPADFELQTSAHTPSLDDSVRSRTRRWRSLAPVVIAVLLVSFTRFAALGQPFKNDAGLYAAMGKAVVDGQPLYVEIWDTKLPGITLLTAPMYAAFGNHWAAWIVVQAIASIAAAAMLADAAARVSHAPQVRPWAFLFAAALLNLHWLLVTGFQLETMMVLASAFAATAFARGVAASHPRNAAGWMTLVGIGGGAAATLKPTGIVVVLAAFAALAVTRRRDSIALLAAMIGGVLLLLIVNVLWFTRLQVWGELPGVLREIRRYGTGTPWTQILTVKSALIVLALLWPAGVLGLASIPTCKPRLQHHTAAALRTLALFAVVWFLGEAAGAIVQKRGYTYHFMPVAAPAALLAGLLCAVARVRARTLWLAAVPVLMLSLWTATGEWRVTLGPDPWGPTSLIAYLQRHTAPDDRIFTDPVGELAVLADRRPGARLGMLIHFVNHDDAPQQFVRQLIDDLERTRCSVILLPIEPVLTDRIAGWERQPVLAAHPQRVRDYRAAWQTYVAYVHANYTRVEGNIDGREVWRRK